WKLKRMAASLQPQVVRGWMNRASRVLPRGAWVNVGRLGGYYDLKYYRRCDHLVCNTPDIRDYVMNSGWPSTRVHYVPNFFSASPGPPADRAALRTPADARVLLVLARLETVKGIDVAIRALGSVANAVLWIAGEGSKRESLEKVARECGVAQRVKFLGWRDDRSALLKAADVCLIPSRHEPFGNVVLGAWTHDVPLVSAASQGPRFLVRDGEDGLLVPVDDPEEMARATTRILGNPELAQALTANGARRVAGEFSEAVVVSQYRELLQRISR
ncbi:MAG: glycosyltransferase, partial [Rhodospirillaceae bacterium]